MILLGRLHRNGGPSSEPLKIKPYQGEKGHSNLKKCCEQSYEVMVCLETFSCPAYSHNLKRLEDHTGHLTHELSWVGAQLWM